MSPRSRLAVLIVPLLLLSAACGTPAPAPTPTPTPTPTPLEVMQGSAARMQEVQSFRAELDMDMDLEVEGESVALTMTAQMAWAQDGTIDMAFTMELPAPLGQMAFQEIVSEGDIYLRLGDLGWFRLTGEAAREFTGLDPETLSLDFFRGLVPAGDVPWDLYTIEDLGREEVDGVQTQHLGIQVDIPRLLRELDPESRQQLIQTFGAFGQDPTQLEELMESAEIRQMEVWIDDQGYQRRTLMEISYGALGTVRFDILVSDLNQDITVQPPDEYREGLPGTEELLQFLTG
ncbi:MAG: hypothetical protein ACE5NC_05250 [Anaerolineae bacterium]